MTDKTPWLYKQIPSSVAPLKDNWCRIVTAANVPRPDHPPGGMILGLMCAVFLVLVAAAVASI